MKNSQVRYRACGNDVVRGVGWPANTIIWRLKLMHLDPHASCQIKRNLQRFGSVCSAHSWFRTSTFPAPRSAQRHPNDYGLRDVFRYAKLSGFNPDNLAKHKELVVSENENVLRGDADGRMDWMDEAQVFIVKASGEKELFSDEKLRRSLQRTGASADLIDEVVDHIIRELHDGMDTAGIYKHAFSILRANKYPLAARYSLRRAVMELGPSGYPFEKFVGELLKAQGFSVEVGKVEQGLCISHEIDVIGEKGNRHIMVECKFHNYPGVKSDVKVALYVHARFKDIEKRWRMRPGHSRKFHEAWLVTNTKLTLDAIAYAACVNMKAIDWRHPSGGNLQQLIERSGLHPLTCLTTLSTPQKRKLLDSGLILCRDVDENKSALKLAGIGKTKIERVIEEINKVCEPYE